MTERYTDSRVAESADTEIELGALWAGVRRRLPLVLAASALIAAGTYVWSRSKPPVYETSVSLITVRPAGGVVGNTLVSASALPIGALDEALKGSTVLGGVIRTVGNSKIKVAYKKQLVSDLQRELQAGSLNTLALSSQLDPGGNGVYTITARAPTALAARILTNLTSQALLRWDQNRALQSVQQALQVQRAQLTDIDQQLQKADLPDLERQTLLTTRSATQNNLTQTSILAQATVGSLALVAPAVEPLAPVAPKPTRNAILMGLLVALLGIGLAALLTISDRTVRSEDDLLAFGLPTLGIIPRLRKRDILLVGIVRAARQAGLYEAIGFLRVNLLTYLDQQLGSSETTVRRVMVSSTAPGEGKSSLTATLADGIAASGQRVLIIDADLRRGTQQEVWDKYEGKHTWRQLIGDKGGRNLQDALRDPANVQVIEAEPNVDVLPAGPGLHDSLTLLNRNDLGDIFSLWSKHYGIVLVDSPPLLALADGLVLGKHVDGIILVTESGRTTMQGVKQVIRRTREARVPMIGFVLNKTSQTNREGYGQNYTYTTRGQEV